ncbi:ankyrin repeat domain-containing protein 54 [Elysia marginata]|uniref:Ankyrin repeat domain-containing protein 54 n=1 Tax=Elysia marginata TaxID=1093978 RepID=A0AAV4I7L4_9GAST|nr:ankyrin repeat domain-containing protein 54 [Elysia marginata]
MDSKLHTAVRYGDEEAVEAALKAGLDPNKIGLLKWNPIHEASHNGERDILKLLVYYKGDVNLQDNLHKNTPLHYAAKEDNSACVTVLLKAGARVDIKNKDGLNCLDVATSYCRDIIQDFKEVTEVDSIEVSSRLQSTPRNSPVLSFFI